MRERLYRVLVNRVPGIRDRYLRGRARGMKRGRALVYLLWLNLQYYLLFRRGLAKPDSAPGGGNIRLYSADSESSLSVRENPEELADRLADCSVVSFDVFDTLVFRPFSSPADLFYMVGMELGYPDFRRIRMETEEKARREKQEKQRTREVTFAEIWEAMERETGIPRERGMEAEWRWEQKACYANPYMLQVVQKLRERKVTLIAASDMYLGKTYIQKLLAGCGYPSFDGCFVSCDEGKSKSDGSLYESIREKMGPHRRYAHVGDNPHADGEQARRHHMDAWIYPNVQQTGNRLRTEDISTVTGSLYRGIVNTHLHSGLTAYSREYEYGFLYGGLFVAGYCRFIHAYAEQNKLDKLLFLSRDGAVLLKAYRQLYPEETEKTVYAYWSRLAAVKLTARFYKAEYFRRFLLHKVNQRFTLRRVLEGMELAPLLPPLCAAVHLPPEAELTHKNVESVKNYLMDAWEQVLALYEDQRTAGGLYYRSLLAGCRRAAAVDIGWAGSGAVMLNCAVNGIWQIGCDITGILAGTNARQSPESDGADPFLFDGRLVSYLYSQQQNRDLWKIHDPAAGHNLYWELLLGAPEGSLIGFYPDGVQGWKCRLKDPPAAPERIGEIHRGILDFVKRFLETEQRLRISIPISGRDAYAPMLAVESRGNKPFRKGLEALLDEMHIG